jgi:hypothetical protein
MALLIFHRQASIHIHCLLVFLLLLSLTTAKTCYFMDGSLATDHGPCRPNDADSPCCRTLAPGVGQPDMCLEPSGLCFAADGLVYEGGCTDPTWKAGACPSVCPDARTAWQGKADTNGWIPGQEVPYWNVMTCAIGLVCCRRYDGTYTNNPSCCQDSTISIATSIGFPVLSDSTSASNVTTPSNVTTCGISTGDVNTTANTSSVVQSSTSNSKSIEIAIGASLGTVSVMALGGLFYFMSYAKALKRQLQSYSRNQDFLIMPKSQDHLTCVAQKHTSLQELDSSALGPHELPTIMSRQNN